MRQTFWALWLLAVALPAGADEPAQRYTVGDTFTQEVVVSRRSAFRVLGIDVVKGAQYAFASTLAITKVNNDGSLEATQTITTARLIDADVDMRESLAAALAKTQGVKFDLTVAADGEVTGLKGLKDSIQVRIGKDEDVGASLRMWSVLDTDAWKELGSRTFFQPDRPIHAEGSSADPAPRKPWTRDATHDWGALGSWKGTTTYAAGKKPDKARLEHYKYGHNLTYQPPVAGSDRDLPLKIVKADFKIVGAGGVILYKPTVRKVARAEEAFRVRGSVLVSLAGVEAAIDMEELQGFRINIVEPAVRRPPAK
jgi:hypothetical protein